MTTVVKPLIVRDPQQLIMYINSELKQYCVALNGIKYTFRAVIQPESEDPLILARAHNNITGNKYVNEFIISLDAIDSAKDTADFIRHALETFVSSFKHDIKRQEMTYAEVKAAHVETEPLTLLQIDGMDPIYLSRKDAREIRRFMIFLKLKAKYGIKELAKRKFWKGYFGLSSSVREE